MTIPGWGRTEKAIGLIYGIGLQNGKGEIAKEHLASIEHLGGSGAKIESQLADGLEVRILTEIHGQRDDLIPALMDEPV